MSVKAAKGFKAGGGAIGIKESGNSDLAIVATEDHLPAVAAAVFTTNQAAAAPVQVSRAHLQTTGGKAVAVVLNSGNANAATGADGRATSEGACELVAKSLQCSREEVLVCSTGLIGIPLPLAPFETGGPAVVATLLGTPEAGEAAAEAIMTTDTQRKEAVVVGSGVTVGGTYAGGRAPKHCDRISTQPCPGIRPHSSHRRSTGLAHSIAEPQSSSFEPPPGVALHGQRHS